MRNFSEASVTAEHAFESSYETALAWARSQQAKARTNVSFTIEGEAGGQGKVTKHTGWLGGQPPYQAIVHSAN